MKRKLLIILLAATPNCLSVLHAQTITVFNMANTPAFTTDIFRTVGVGKGGYVYAGTLRQGFYKFDGTTWQKLSVLTNNSINDIQTDGFGGIWVGQSGHNTGGNSITGGINYFPDSTLTGYVAYGSSDGVLTRNCRSLFIDKQGYFINNRTRIWAAHINDITGTTVKSGGGALGLNSSNPFFTRRPGTDSTNNLGTAQSVGGNATEVWVFADANYGKNQILRYESSTGALMGVYDQDNTPALIPGFYARSIYFDKDGRQWLGMSSGGLLVKNGSTWTTVNMPSIFPSGTLINNNAIFEDISGNIYVGTTNGLAIYSGGVVDIESSWKLMTTADGLPHNNVFDITENDSNGTVIIATTGGIAFMSQNIKAELVWDNSFPKPSNTKPKGVAADGVSRLYLKITGGTGSPNLHKAEVSIIDELGKPANIKGKLKKAVASTFSYNEEASAGTGHYAMDEFFPGRAEFWFWYVSPEDYCNGNTVDASFPERLESIKIVITFSNGSKDSTELQVRIVRPPLVLVHGLASGPEAWANFKFYGGPFLTSGLFKERKALKLSGKASFIDNARSLLDEYNPSSLQYNIDELRLKGYASNQVDYVCHSMGGLMLRSAIENFPKYKGSDHFKNYSKGFVHKMVTINTPHNSSPIPDFLNEYVPDIPIEGRLALSAIYKLYPSASKPFDFIEPSIKSNVGLLIAPFKVTPAVRNLQVRTAKGGVDMKSTFVKNHMIAGNVNWTSPGVARFIAAIDPLLEIIDEAVDAARDKAITPVERAYLTTLYALNKTARAWSFIERYSERMGYPNFLGSSDLIVPYASQLARQNASSPHITTFFNSPGSLWDANHVSILDRLDVGNTVMHLLNAPLNSDLFADVIPANTDQEPLARISLQLGDPIQITNQYGASKIEIISPASGPTHLLADSAINVNILVKDTVDLAYIKVYFQNNDSATISRQSSQTFAFTVNPTYTDTQIIRAVAVYDKPGSVEYHVDTVIKVVSNAAIADSFRLSSDTTIITTGEDYFPPFEIYYSGKWVGIPYSSGLITAQVEDPAVLSYQADKSFVGLQQGKSRVYFSYLSFKDTLKLEVNPGLFENTVNRTLASGNLKNPLIWSKGRIPFDTDSIVIMSGHSIILDSAIKVRAINVQTGGSLNLMSGADSLKVGEQSTGKNTWGIKSIYDLTTILSTRKTLDPLLFIEQKIKFEFDLLLLSSIKPFAKENNIYRMTG